MESKPPFQLDPVSPDDRAAKLKRQREAQRESMRRSREEAKKAGYIQTAFLLPKTKLSLLKSLKKAKKLSSQNEALVLILDAVGNHPEFLKELGL